ncbi:hypothetical protein OUHCRE13_45070 [Enterobacter roggenkampii]|nr:hypothetical protein TUM16664_37430 [Enterobacter cloacae]SAA63485.1 Uncharacterised protein [Enterobacter roggenkampii]
MDSNPRMQIAPENQVLHRVALRTDDIDQTHAELRSQGLQVSPIVNGQRNDPQGNVISWRIFTIDGDFNGLPYPFVLQWGEDDNARLTRLRAQGLDKPHPAGEVTLQSAIFEVQDPQAAREHWHALFGFNELSEGLSAGQQRFLFRQGEANRLVELVFNASDPSLKGQRFRVGRGEYRFQ